MHPLFKKAESLTETMIAAAIEVHRDKGPGLIESIYEWCLLKELGFRGLTCVSEKTILNQSLLTSAATTKQMHSMAKSRRITVQREPVAADITKDRQYLLGHLFLFRSA